MDSDALEKTASELDNVVLEASVTCIEEIYDAMSELVKHPMFGSITPE